MKKKITITKKRTYKNAIKVKRVINPADGDSIIKKIKVDEEFAADLFDSLDNYSSSLKRNAFIISSEMEKGDMPKFIQDIAVIVPKHVKDPLGYLKEFFFDDTLETNHDEIMNKLDIINKNIKTSGEYVTNTFEGVIQLQKNVDDNMLQLLKEAEKNANTEVSQKNNGIEFSDELVLLSSINEYELFRYDGIIFIKNSNSLSTKDCIAIKSHNENYGEVYTLYDHLCTQKHDPEVYATYMSVEPFSFGKNGPKTPDDDPTKLHHDGDDSDKYLMTKIESNSNSDTTATISNTVDDAKNERWIYLPNPIANVEEDAPKQSSPKTRKRSIVDKADSVIFDENGKFTSTFDTVCKDYINGKLLKADVLKKLGLTSYMFDRYKKLWCEENNISNTHNRKKGKSKAKHKRSNSIILGVDTSSDEFLAVYDEYDNNKISGSEAAKKLNISGSSKFYRIVTKYRKKLKETEKIISNKDIAC